MSIHYAETKYGFEYVAAKIERMASDKGRVWLELSTPKSRLEIYVTKTGKVRIFDRKTNKELK